MKTARLQVLITPAFRDWLQKEAELAGVSVRGTGPLPLRAPAH